MPTIDAVADKLGKKNFEPYSSSEIMYPLIIDGECALLVDELIKDYFDRGIVINQKFLLERVLSIYSKINQKEHKLGEIIYLSALINNTNKKETHMIQEISIADISPNPYQSRIIFDQADLDMLANSIKEFGLMQPVVVAKNKDKGYTLISGERRWRSCQSLGMITIKANIMENEVTDQSFVVDMIDENETHKSPSNIEQGLAYRRYLRPLVDENGKIIRQAMFLTNLSLAEALIGVAGRADLTKDELAARLARSKRVSECVREANISPFIENTIRQGGIDDPYLLYKIAVISKDLNLKFDYKFIKMNQALVPIDEKTQNNQLSKRIDLAYIKLAEIYNEFDHSTKEGVEQWRKKVDEIIEEGLSNQIKSFKEQYLAKYTRKYKSLNSSLFNNGDKVKMELNYKKIPHAAKQDIDQKLKEIELILQEISGEEEQ
jgi:ParB/RepB/Spo0J family partition protein